MKSRRVPVWFPPAKGEMSEGQRETTVTGKARANQFALAFSFSMKRWPVSRILWPLTRPMIIYLLPRLLADMASKGASGRSDQPGNSAGRVIVSCLVLHRTRVARPQHRCCAGALLPHRFTLTNRSWRFIFCCPVSHALRRGSPLTTVLPYGVRTFLTPE